MEEQRNRKYFPTSPQYSSSLPTPPGSADEQADQVRGAVASFNARMLERYGENDENIPESDGYSPRTPTSPAYSSIFQEGGQRTQRGGRAGKFIPQIPASVVENYLNSKYGVSPKNMSSHVSDTANQSISGIMSGGMASGLPTMNIPVVATMPMAGMMPIQQQSTGIQSQQSVSGVAPGTSGQQQQQQALGQTGGGANGTTNSQSNAQGVKTFSIKI